MRPRYDEEGNIKSYHRMVFDNIPDDYQMKKVILNDKVFDLSYLGVMKHLRTIEAGEEFLNPVFYSSQVLEHMALDYLNSARLLYQGIVSDRDGNTVTHYLIPCAFLCKHSIELKLKECLLAKGEMKLKGHSVLAIWEQLGENDMKQYKEITEFLREVEKIDSNEMALRYGISKQLEPLKEEFKFDIESLLCNTMFLFNVVDEFLIHKYRYTSNE